MNHVLSFTFSFTHFHVALCPSVPYIPPAVSFFFMLIHSSFPHANDLPPIRAAKASTKPMLAAAIVTVTELR